MLKTLFSRILRFILFVGVVSASLLFAFLIVRGLIEQAPGDHDASTPLVIATPIASLSQSLRITTDTAWQGATVINKPVHSMTRAVWVRAAAGSGNGTISRHFWIPQGSTVSVNATRLVLATAQNVTQIVVNDQTIGGLPEFSPEGTSVEINSSNFKQGQNTITLVLTGGSDTGDPGVSLALNINYSFEYNDFITVQYDTDQAWWVDHHAGSIGTPPSQPNSIWLTNGKSLDTVSVIGLFEVSSEESKSSFTSQMAFDTLRGQVFINQVPLKSNYDVNQAVLHVQTEFVEDCLSDQGYDRGFGRSSIANIIKSWNIDITLPLKRESVGKLLNAGADWPSGQSCSSRLREMLNRPHPEVYSRITVNSNLITHILTPLPSDFLQTGLNTARIDYLPFDPSELDLSRGVFKEYGVQLDITSEGNTIFATSKDWLRGDLCTILNIENGTVSPPLTSRPEEYLTGYFYVPERGELTIEGVYPDTTEAWLLLKNDRLKLTTPVFLEAGIYSLDVLSRQSADTEPQSVQINFKLKTASAEHDLSGTSVWCHNDSAAFSQGANSGNIAILTTVPSIYDSKDDGKDAYISSLWRYIELPLGAVVVTNDFAYRADDVVLSLELNGNQIYQQKAEIRSEYDFERHPIIPSELFEGGPNQLTLRYYNVGGPAWVQARLQLTFFVPSPISN